MSTKKRTSPIDHALEMMKRFKVIMEKEKFCDVILISGVDGRQIPTHRLILAAASDYFDTMFSGTMKEATEKEVTINEIDGKTLQSLVTYCYTGELNLQEENAEKILSSAHQLQFLIAVEKCAEFMERKLNPANCLGIKFLAEHYNCTELEFQAQSFICKNFYHVAKSEDFFKLSFDQLDDLLSRDDCNLNVNEIIFLCLMSWVQHDEVNRQQYIPKLLLNIQIDSANCLGIKYLAEQFKFTQLEARAQSYICLHFDQVMKSKEFLQLSVDQLDSLLSRDDLTVELEENIFRSLISWVRHDVINRDKDIAQLLLNVRMPLMDSKFIFDKVKNVCKVHGCSDLVIEALEWKLYPNNVPGIDLKGIQPRSSYNGCLLTYQFHEFANYCPELNKWTPFNEMTSNEEVSDVIVWREKLVIFCPLSSKSLKYWDVKHKSWRDLSSLKTYRDYFTLAVLGDSLYAMGGGAMEHLDSITGEWQYEQPMPMSLKYLKIAVHNECTYVEGTDYYNHIAHFLSYSRESRWTHLGMTLKDPVSLLVINGELYGVRANLIRRYKSGNSWITCATKCPDILHAFAFKNRFMVVVREKDDNVQLKEYKPDTNTWVKLAPLSWDKQNSKFIYIPSTII